MIHKDECICVTTSKIVETKFDCDTSFRMDTQILVSIKMVSNLSTLAVHHEIARLNPRTGPV